MPLAAAAAAFWSCRSRIWSSSASSRSRRISVLGCLRTRRFRTTFVAIGGFSTWSFSSSESSGDGASSRSVVLRLERCGGTCDCEALDIVASLLRLLTSPVVPVTATGGRESASESSEVVVVSQTLEMAGSSSSSSSKAASSGLPPPLLQLSEQLRGDASGAPSPNASSSASVSSSDSAGAPDSPTKLMLIDGDDFAKAQIGKMIDFR